MSITAEQVLDYIDTHPLRFQDGDFASLLDMLHSVYADHNPIYSENIHTHFSQLRCILDKLSPRETDALFDHICDLCLEYEHTAFAHGILVGLYLHTELSTLC